MRDDIPLQTPMGNYSPSWLRRYRAWLLAIALGAVAMYAGAVIVTTLARPEPTSLDTQIVVSASLPVSVRPGSLHHVVNVEGKPVSKDFELTNKSDSPVGLTIAIRGRGSDFTRVAPARVVWTSSEYGSGVTRSGTEVQNFRCLLEVGHGISQDGTIAPRTSARMRLTFTNLGGTSQGGFSMLLLISPAH